MSDAPRTYTNKKPIFCCDFDGVLHSYISGWKGATVIPDPPVRGALEFLTKAVEFFEVHIFSSRSHEPGGIEAMQQWLFDAYNDNELFKEESIKLFVEETIKWPVNKPPAKITLDDRAIRFDGTFPPMSELSRFTTWQGK